ncbi:MAG: class I SAM-dependent methyltransferase [Candidatus Levyibacteriota bacterium]
MKSLESETDRFMREHYTGYYHQTKGHVPPEAKKSLVSRMAMDITSLDSSACVLDLGSGRQMTERFLNIQGIKPSCRIVTLDLAGLLPNQLLERKNEKITHLRGDGSRLPFRDSTFHIVFSDMAVELMPDRALSELARVLKPNGRAYINVLNPFVPEIQREKTAERLTQDAHIRSARSNRSDKQWLEYWNRYLSGSSLFVSENAPSVQKLQKEGLSLARFQEIQGKETRWIEIDLVKKAA